MLRTLLAATTLTVFGLATASAGTVVGGLAAVDHDGTLAHGVNVVKVKQTLSGFTKVRFKKSIRGCYLFANATSPAGDSYLNATLTVTPVPDPNNKKTARVFIWSTTDSQYELHGFYLRADC